MMNPTCQLALRPGSFSARSMSVLNDEVYALPVAKPIRIFQFLIVAILFAITIWSISKETTPFDNVVVIMLTAVFSSFLFIALIDIISQFGGDPIPDTPMFLFGVVGTVLFLIAAGGVFFIWSRAGSSWELLLIICLSGSCAVLYLIDVLLIFLYGY